MTDSKATSDALDAPCFVVSLKRSVERRQHITREFERAGLRFEFVDAVDGAELSDVRVSHSLGVPIAPGDAACTMSHGRAMKALIDRGHDRALIFEDDAWLAPNLADIVPRLLSAPVAWEVLKLSGFSTPHFTKSVDYNGYRFIWPQIASLSGHGYIISATGAKKLIPFTDPADDIFDVLLQQVWRTKVELLEVLPRPVGGIAILSTIERGNTYEQRPEFSARWRRRIAKIRRSLWKRIRF